MTTPPTNAPTLRSTVEGRKLWQGEAFRGDNQHATRLRIGYLCADVDTLLAALGAAEAERGQWKLVNERSVRGRDAAVEDAARAKAERDLLRGENERLRERIVPLEGMLRTHHQLRSPNDTLPHKNCAVCALLGSEEAK